MGGLVLVDLRNIRIGKLVQMEVVKGVAERIRQLSRLVSDGAELINEAFSMKAPILVINPLITDSEKSEQKGFAQLLIGVFGMVRNPLAHAPRTTWPMPEQDALDILTLVSLVHRKLDGTSKTSAPACASVSAAP